MRATLEEEEELDAQTAYRRDGEPDREVTLSSTTLLVIFFGLVLICGLCFAFGYTLGRRTPLEASTNQATASPAPASITPQTFDSHPKPSAGSQSNAPPAQPQQAAASDSATPDTKDAPAETQSISQTPLRALPEPKPVAAQPTLKLATTVTPALATTSPAAPAASVSGVLVQIAAVSNPADADVLLGALRKRGYTVNVRHEPADALLHVQVGPFANRADAIAMRQKLLADGYNAILK